MEYGKQLDSYITKPAACREVFAITINGDHNLKLG